MVEAVGVDIGNSAIKVASRAGAWDIPTLTARGTVSQLLPVQGADRRSVAVVMDGVPWLVGEHATLGSNFVWRLGENKGGLKGRLAITVALGLLGIEHAEIVVGLPIDLADNKKACDSAKQDFSGEWSAEVNGRKMQFMVSAQVVAEPIGTFYRCIVDENFKPLTSSALYRGELAVVDCGYKTLDVATCRHGILGEAKGSSLSCGTGTVFEKAWKILEQSHGVMLKANERVRVFEAITKNFGTNSLRINGEFISPSFWTEIRKLKQQLAFDVVDETKGILGNTSPDFIIATGGGSLFLKEEFGVAAKSWQILEDGRFANAIGFFRIAQISLSTKKQG